MQNKNHLKKIFIVMTAMGMLSVSQSIIAAGFQLFEQDAVSVANYHAGAAALADDASTTWYNPAGLVRLKNQQLILGSNFVDAYVHFKGTVGVNNFLNQQGNELLPPQLVSVNAGGWNTVPFLHYAAPITDKIVFGLSTVVPFGAETNYGSTTFARYAATLTSIEVLDITPSLGFLLSDKFSAGFGVDIQRLRSEFNLIGTALFSSNDTSSKNVLYSTDYGFHLGGLYQFNSDTRLGLGYHSKVVHHMQGNSDLKGPLANPSNISVGGEYRSNQLEADLTMPAMTTLSLFHSLNKAWDVMGSLSYIQWNVFQNFTLQNAAGVDETTDALSKNITVTVPEHYHNTWNIALGAHYHPCDQWIIRTGLGYDQTPSNDTDRNLQIPDSDRIAIAVGGGYQITKTLAVDAGYTHVFVMNSRINDLTQTVGAHQTVTNGAIHSSANVYGVQLKWDIV